MDNLAPNFSVIIPKPFDLATQDPTEVRKLKDEVMDKERTWETRMTTNFEEMQEAANSWRMIPRAKGGKKPYGLFNSKSGETTRAVNTLSSLWFRMLTSNDPFIEAKRQGLWMGREITEEELYAIEGVLIRQMQVLDFKDKLLRTLKSVALFGTAIVEEPWISMPVGSDMKTFEGTDFLHRSLLQTGFDPYCFDIGASDYIFTIDFPTKYKLRELAAAQQEIWNKDVIEQAIEAQSSNSSNAQFDTETFNRIQNRKERAGYDQNDKNFFELINYHGRLDTSNKVLQNLWESEGRTDDMRFSDFTCGILSGQGVCKLFPTPYGTWKHSFKTFTTNSFELEAIGYGVGKMGKKYQRELDFVQSKAGDALTLNIYAMKLVGKYAGIKASDLGIKPNGLVEMEDIEQMKDLKSDLNAIVQGLAMMGMWKEDFRTITGATTNLQAEITKGTATEASLTQNEAIRGASVNAEILGEAVRKHIETMHINNTDMLDNDIFVEISGVNKPMIRGFNKTNLPRNIGLRVLVNTDKDFRNIENIIKVVGLITSVRQDLPDWMNSLRPLLTQAFRVMGIDPRELNKPKPMIDVISQAIRRAAISNQGSGGKGSGTSMGNEVQGEQQGGNTGAIESMPTPVGPVPTSPNAPSLVEAM